MRFLLDVRVASGALRKSLVEGDHDVLSARDGYARASDEALLAVAHRERRVLVTADKDFGELVFLLRLPHPCIVRLVGLSVSEHPEALRQLINAHGAFMRESALIVVTPKRVRIRAAP